MGAITAALVKAGHHRLRYLLTAATTGTDSVTITTTGGATPDTLTDAGTKQGTIINLSKAFTNGYGSFAAGALTQAQARALWLADNTGASPSVAGSLEIPVAFCWIEPIATGGEWLVDANVDGSGHPTIVVSSVGAATGQTAYLDILSPGTIGA